MNARVRSGVEDAGLVADLESTVDVPPHDNSAMDGYALCLADLGASPVGQALPQGQRIAAGHLGQQLAPGTCARIFTGATVPVHEFPLDSWLRCSAVR